MRIALTSQSFVDVSRGESGTVYLTWRLGCFRGAAFRGHRWLLLDAERMGGTCWIFVGPLVFILRND